MKSFKNLTKDQKWKQLENAINKCYKSGLANPIDGSYCEKEKNGCCALTAAYFVLANKNPKKFSHPDDVHKFLKDLGFTRNDLYGVINGFDNNGKGTSDSYRGFALGKKMKLRWLKKGN